MENKKPENQQELEKMNNFASFGQEVFELSKKEDKNVINSDDAVILNLLEEDTDANNISPIEFGTQTKRFRLESTGNPFVDFFHKINFYLIKHSQIKGELKGTFFHLLGVMINAGIPMIKALNALIRQSDKSPKMKIIIQDLVDSIIAGMSLSKAMQQFPDTFTEQEFGMIQAGEASGQLSRTLEVLAHDAEKASSIKKKVKSALMYPAVIFTLLIAVIIIMLVYVIPQLTDLFSSIGGELPLITRVVVGLSDFLINQKLILISGVLIVVFAFIIAGKNPQGRYLLDKMKLSIPVFGGLFKKAYLSRFARSLSNLLDSSVTILKTIEITARSIGSEVYKKKLILTLEDIKQGIPIAEAISESDLFPPMLVSMVEVGEKTAQLDTIMAQVADFYESDVDTAVAGLSKIIEPIILVVIGLTVGAVVAAIILPIMQLSNLTGGM